MKLDPQHKTKRFALKTVEKILCLGAIALAVAAFAHSVRIVVDAL